MESDALNPIPTPDHAAEESRRDSLDQQVKFVGQRILQLEQQVLDIERELPEIDRRLEETRGTPAHETIVDERGAKGLDRLRILESIAAAKKEIDLLKAQRAFVG